VLRYVVLVFLILQQQLMLLHNGMHEYRAWPLVFYFRSSSCCCFIMALMSLHGAAGSTAVYLYVIL
jgi:hypothetical protein